MEKDDPTAAAAFHEFLARMVATRLVQANELLESGLAVNYPRETFTPVPFFNAVVTSEMTRIAKSVLAGLALIASAHRQHQGPVD